MTFDLLELLLPPARRTDHTVSNHEWEELKGQVRGRARVLEARRSEHSLGTSGPVRPRSRRRAWD